MNIMISIGTMIPNVIATVSTPSSLCARGPDVGANGGTNGKQYTDDRLDRRFKKILKRSSSISINGKNLLLSKLFSIYRLEKKRY